MALSSGVNPFYLPGSSGQLFVAHFRPEPESSAGVGLLYLHPFAEEMHFSRAIVARQWHELRRVGVDVLVVELFGCGDSAGEFRDARWDRWKDDVRRSLCWLASRGCYRIAVCGLRLGSLLALQCARESAVFVDRVILWQPPAAGEEVVTQFLRLRTAFNGLFAVDRKVETTADLRSMLRGGQTVEVAGYELAPELAAALDELKLSSLTPDTRTTVEWVEFLPRVDAPWPRLSIRIAEEWRKAGVVVNCWPVAGKPPSAVSRGNPGDYIDLLNVMKRILLQR